MKCPILAALLSLTMSVPLAVAGPLQEYRCGKVLEAPGGPAQLVVDDQLHVLDQTRSQALFDPGPPPKGTSIKSIFCARSDIVPAPFDYKVVQAGYPFTIYSRDGDGKTRIVLLEFKDGRLRLRSIGHTGLTAQMVQRIQAFLDQSLLQWGKIAASP